MILCGLLAPAHAADAGPGTRATVNADSVPVHAETSRASRVLRTLAKGDVFPIAYSVETVEGAWCGTSDASSGYVQCGYLTREEPVKAEAAETAPLPQVLIPAVRAVRHPGAPVQPAPAGPVVATAEQSALMSAAKAGNVTALQLALGKGAIVNGRDKDGKTALMWAASMGRAEAVTELLSQGADVNAADNLGWTALEAAVWSRHPAIVELLLDQNLEVNARDSEGRTPLMHAAQYGDLVMIRDLVAKGADPNARNRFDQTPLMFAVALNDTATAEALLAAGADANARDAAGRTVLINAVLAGSERAANVKLLIEQGSETNTRDNDGRTALGWALRKGYTAIAQLLKKAGATE